MTAEEIFRQEYFKLPNASEEDWIEAPDKSNDMHQCIVKAMELYHAKFSQPEKTYLDKEKVMEIFDKHSLCAKNQMGNLSEMYFDKVITEICQLAIMMPEKTKSEFVEQIESFIGQQNYSSVHKDHLNKILELAKAIPEKSEGSGMSEELLKQMAEILISIKGDDSVNSAPSKYLSGFKYLLVEKQIRIESVIDKYNKLLSSSSNPVEPNEEVERLRKELAEANIMIFLQRLEPNTDVPFRVAYMRDLEKQLTREEITYSRMVGLLNEKASAFYKSQTILPADKIAEALPSEIFKGLKELSNNYEVIGAHYIVRKELLDAAIQEAEQSIQQAIEKLSGLCVIPTTKEESQELPNKMYEALKDGIHELNGVLRTEKSRAIATSNMREAVSEYEKLKNR